MKTDEPIVLWHGAKWREEEAPIHPSPVVAKRMVDVVERAEQLFNVLQYPKTIRDLMDATGWTSEIVYTVIRRLLREQRVYRVSEVANKFNGRRAVVYQAKDADI